MLLSRSLVRRQQTGRGRAPGAGFSNVREVIRGLRDRLDQSFDGVPILILNLEEALQRFVTQSRPGSSSEAEWRGVVESVGAITQKLLVDVQAGHGHGPDSMANPVNEQLQRDREVSRVLFLKVTTDRPLVIRQPRASLV